jgi:uncharacterized protein (DUF302 family)
MSHAPTTTATPVATTYGFHCDIDDKDFGSAVARVTEALKTEGFGVLTEIDSPTAAWSSASWTRWPCCR